MSDSDKKSIYDKLTPQRKQLVDEILKMLETDKTLWKKGWLVSGSPVSAITGKQYNGVNRLFLGIAAMQRGYSDNRWVTYNQMEDKGWSFKRDEQGNNLGKGAGVAIEYFEFRDKETKKPFDRHVLDGMTEEEKNAYIDENVYPLRKYYRVFNGDVIDGIPEKQQTALADNTAINERAENLIQLWNDTEVPIFYGGDRAYYDRKTDEIHLPEKEKFFSLPEYYSTAMHEIGHSTGHVSRLNRDMGEGKHTPEYAVEELRAEIANNRNVSTIVGKFFLALLGTMAMLAVVFLGILIANALLQLLSKIFQVENTTKLSNAIFNACVGEWVNGYNINKINVTNLSVGQIFGGYNTALFGIWPTGWKCNGMVNPNSFMYLPALIAGIALCIALVIAVLNLAKRIYEIFFIFFCMPVSMSTMPLDDGARFKNWREQFLTKIILAYGAVLAVNVFVLLLPLIQQMHLPGVGGFGNAMFTIFMIVGGAMIIPAGQTLFARLFGVADDMHAGGGWLRSAYYGGRVVGGLTIGLAAKGIKGIAHAVHRHKYHDADSSDSSDNADSAADGDDQYTDDGSSAETAEGGRE